MRENIMGNKFLLMTGREKYPLFDRLSKNWSNFIVPVESLSFKNENIKVKIKTCVRGADIFVVQPCYPNLHERIFELFQMIDALKSASARTVTAVLPYFPYGRSDKKDEARISITAKMMAKLLQAVKTDRVLTVCLHSPQAQGFFDIPTDHLLPGKLVCEYFQEKGIITSSSEIIGPDTGSAKMCSYYARRLNLPLGLIDKKRVDDTENPISGSITGDVSGKNCLIIDDEIATGRSIFKASENLIKNGAREVSAFAVHGVLVGDSLKELDDSPLKKLYITDTIWRPEIANHSKIEVISIAQMLSDAIMCINGDWSMADIFDR
jgi:ribose-phosphate pyrophosphokinase